MKTLPNTVVGMIEELEELYPPRCMESDETLEDHLRYAGKVDLVARLRRRYDAELRSEGKELPKVIRR